MTIQEVYDIYVYNLNILQQCFPYESIRFLSLSALTTNQKLCVEKVNMCTQIIKNNTGFFSNFRGWMQMPLAVKLSLLDEPEVQFKRMLNVYDLLKAEFTASNFLVLGASVIYNNVVLEEMPVYIQKAKALYQGMKENHPYLTSSEDYVLALTLAFSNKDANLMLEEMEELYVELKSEVSKNVAQLLSHIFVLSDTPMQTMQTMLQIKQQLENEGMNYGKYFEVCALSSLAFSNNNNEALIIEADKLLQQHPKYKGIFGIDKRTRAMHAALLVTNIQGHNEMAHIASITHAIIELINQQVMLCCMIAATSASAS